MQLVALDFIIPWKALYMFRVPFAPIISPNLVTARAGRSRLPIIFQPTGSDNIPIHDIQTTACTILRHS
jgi:hypothetical protein